MNLLWLYPILVFSVVIHELGHAFCGWLVGKQLMWFCIGVGPVGLQTRAANTTFEFRLVPLIGAVEHCKVAVENKYQNLLVAVGGPAASLIAMWAALAVEVSNLTPAFLVGPMFLFAFLQGFVVIFNFLPGNTAIGGLNLESDGTQILKLLKGPRKITTEAGVFFQNEIHRYDPLSEERLGDTAASPRVVYFCRLQNKWHNYTAFRQATDGLLRELARSGLSPGLEMFLLDSLATDELLYHNANPKNELGGWSRRALELGPNIQSLQATRGASLVALGQSAQGKEILQRQVLDAVAKPFDAFVTLNFLARAEIASNDLEAAQDLVNAAKAVPGLENAAPAVRSLLENTESRLALARAADAAPSATPPR